MIPKVTYFILNWNPFDNQLLVDSLEKTIDSLYCNSSENIRKEVYLINQDYTNGLSKQIESLRKKYNFNIITLDKNIGISGGINLGFNIARGEIISLLTYDIIAPKDCDVSCISLLESSSNIYQVIPSDKTSDISGQRFNKNKEYESIIASELTLVYYNRETLKTIGYYDEKWKACYENMDYNLRTVISGKKIIVNNKACIEHDHNISNRYIGLDHAYSGYISNAIGGGRLAKMWNDKWGNIASEINLEGLNTLSEDQIKSFENIFKSNLYLGFNQNREY